VHIVFTSELWDGAFFDKVLDNWAKHPIVDIKQYYVKTGENVIGGNKEPKYP